MPKFLVAKWNRPHQLVLFAVMFLFIIVLAWYDTIIGLISFIVAAAVVVYYMVMEHRQRKELKKYIATLSYRLHKAGIAISSELPLGIILYSEEQTVEWSNDYITGLLAQPTLIGSSLSDLFPALQHGKEREQIIEAAVDNRIYRLQFKPNDRILFVSDVTELRELRYKYEDEQLSLGIVMIDNLDEVTQGLDDLQRSTLLSGVTSIITEWAQKYSLYLKRLNSDRFLLITDYATLRTLEQSRFVILDEVRELTADQKIPVTLSIGFAALAEDTIQLGEWTHRSLDIALGRGGDQAAVKVGNRQTFYGGKTNAVEKRTRVRARVVAHALRDLIKESHNVIIMGHKLPDMDAVGAAIGVLKAAQTFGKEAYIVLEGINPAIQKMMEMLREDERISRRFISPEQASNLLTGQSLVVVVDTHKASMVASPGLLQVSDRIVIIDHHRRGEEFIANPMLVYMEPYASSTCELVAELLQYIHDRISLDIRESTALLAGITVDTKSFMSRTGARTFEAASFLRRHGADSAMIQRMLKENLQEYIIKSEMIKYAKVHYEHIAIAVVENEQQYPQLLIAQSADTLLNMTGIRASFVIAERSDSLIGVSARSLGQMNVQVVMERMGGGGHLSNAATQLQGTVDEVYRRLQQVLADIEQEEGLFE